MIADLFAGGGGASTGIEEALGVSPDVAINHDPEALAMHAANHPETRHLCGDVWHADPEVVCDGEPVELAWVVVRWARTVRPRVICLENVEEFADWGPLLNDGSPHPDRKGWTFRRWVGCLKAAGYVVEMRELRACDYGAPTTRKRLFVIARCDGEPIVWPTPTHGPGRKKPWRTAAECIDWALPCPSIFDRKKPLAEKTLRRIARGIRKFVIESARPFIVPTAHGGDETRCHSIDEPLRTITGQKRGDHALIAPTLIQQSWGERKGQAPRILDIEQPLGTVVAGGVKHALVAAFLTKHFGGPHEGVNGAQLDLPCPTVTTVDHNALTAAYLMKYYGQGTGSDAGAPVPTVTAGAEHLAQVRAFLARYNGDAVGQQVDLPLGAVTTARRFGLVTVEGSSYQIVDIGMRMLTARELYRAQGFGDGYVIDPVVNGKPLSKTAQIRCCGNSVAPPVAEALVRANVGESRDRRVA